MGDNIDLPDRNGVRTPMQWDGRLNAGFSQADPDSLYAPVIHRDPFGQETVNVSTQQADLDSLWNTLKHMISVRKEHRVFGWGDFAWLETGTPALAAYRRSYEREQAWIINNLSREMQQFSLDLTGYRASAVKDMLTGELIPLAEREWLSFTLQPYQYLWLEGVSP